MKLTNIVAIAAALAFAPFAWSAVDLAAGKTTYENNCTNCHGVAGSGNPIADQFWKVRIPRLRDDYVQAKPDKEIETVILNGKRKMPALVLSAETSHKTKVVAEQISDLIAYIRTLKKK